MKESFFCAAGERHLASYLEGRLRQAELADYEAHLQSCAHCREQVEVWRHLGDWRVPPPSADFPARFTRMLAEEQARESAQSRGRMPSRRPWALWAASAAALAILSAGGGYWFGARSGERELARLDGEMRSLRSWMAVSLLQQQSAIERLRGVSYSVGLERANDQVVQALVETLRGDSSVDVRLAAADALRRYAGRPQVRAAVAEALPVQDSPLLQIALIDTLSEWKEPRARQSFELLAARPDTDETVKRRLEAALAELKVGGRLQ